MTGKGIEMSEVMKFSEMTDEQLKKMALIYHEVIYVYGQSSHSDLNRMARSMQELCRRGYEVFEVPRLVIQKPEEEELAIPRPEPGKEHLVRPRLVQSEEEHFGSL
jgi:hypothetical protein